MIQRKQTIYLLLAIVCFIVNATLPIGYIVPEGMGIPSTINCLGVVDGTTGELTMPFKCIPIIFLAINILQSLTTIFMYNNRKAQMTSCKAQIAGIIIQYVLCGGLIWYTCINETTSNYNTAFSICLPIVAIILLVMAHKGIMDDERLVRSADRIR